MCARRPATHTLLAVVRRVVAKHRIAPRAFPRAALLATRTSRRLSRISCPRPQHPVSIAVEADKAVFQSYKSGVMTGVCGSNLDHGILAVGYGTEDGTDYWLVKNSWVTVWGLDGFGKLERGKGGEGECGILEMPSYPTVSSAASSIVV